MPTIEPDLEERIPIVPFLTYDDSGKPALFGTRCDACATISVGKVNPCPRCGSRDSLERVWLASTGRLYNYTIVYRSLPDVPTPFVSAIVNLDGGGSIKANLDVEHDALKFDMPVKAVFEHISAVDPKGRRYHSFHFVAA